MAIAPCKNHSHPFSMGMRQRKLSTAKASQLNDTQARAERAIVSNTATTKDANYPHGNSALQRRIFVGV